MRPRAARTTRDGTGSHKPATLTAPPPLPSRVVSDSPDFSALIGLVRAHPRLFVLTGAGCSTDSGIPDYRDNAGAWKRKPPVDHRDFVADAAVRRRYWARSLIGWQHFGRAGPNAAHHALAALEAQGHVVQLVTQNVDGLHQAAGSRAVIDLHGRIDRVMCLHCGSRLPRADFQSALAARNPAWMALQARAAPDGDADLEADFDTFEVVPCPACGGVLKPDVVFFGDSVPMATVRTAMDALADADAMLVAGSSLMVYSGLRFVRAAAALGKPVACVNLGRTRADALFTCKVSGPCGTVLPALSRALAPCALPQFAQ